MEIDINNITEDALELELGARAYRQGDYETALSHYKKSAAAGNVRAYSNLGYCYYYGRGTAADKELARNCWEKAAIYSDVCATFKLGDMYRNGDLPEDPVFSRGMYLKAFGMAMETGDINCYPDACLRILRYCRDAYSLDILQQIALDAVRGFEQRAKSGDAFAEQLYYEAEKHLVEIWEANHAAAENGADSAEP